MEILRSKKSSSIEIDYYDAALREYYEESMGILETVIDTEREVFVHGKEHFGTWVALWPIQVKYDADIGKIYRRVGSYVRDRKCLDIDGKMAGICKDGRVEKVDAKWITVNDAIKLIRSDNVTGGIKHFQNVYEEFLMRLMS